MLKPELFRSYQTLSHSLSFQKIETHLTLSNFLLILLILLIKMPINKDPSTPAPMIGKIGPYTVFMTPPSTPKPADPVFDSPKKVVSPPPVQPPPQQILKSVSSQPSVSGFFRNAVTKVQNAHSSLDEHLARWFGLNQSKYQWALDDYYESKELGKEDGKAKELSSKVQSV